MTMFEVSLIEITPEFFEDLRTYNEFQEILRDLDIADEDQLDLFDTLDVDGGGTIDLEELIVGISKLRGDARRSDIIGVNLITRNLQTALLELATTVQQMQDAQGMVLRTCRNMSHRMNVSQVLNSNGSLEVAIASERVTRQHSDIAVR